MIGGQSTTQGSGMVEPWPWPLPLHNWDWGMGPGFASVAVAARLIPGFMTGEVPPFSWPVQETRSKPRDYLGLAAFNPGL